MSKQQPMQSPPSLTPAEAVFGVMVWLSLHKPMTVGEGCSMAPLTRLAREFCESHELGDVDDYCVLKINPGPKDVFKS